MPQDGRPRRCRRAVLPVSAESREMPPGPCLKTADRLRRQQTGNECSGGALTETSLRSLLMRNCLRCITVATVEMDRLGFCRVTVLLGSFSRREGSEKNRSERGRCSGRWSAEALHDAGCALGHCPERPRNTPKITIESTARPLCDRPCNTWSGPSRRPATPFCQSSAGQSVMGRFPPPLPPPAAAACATALARALSSRDLIWPRRGRSSESGRPREGGAARRKRLHLCPLISRQVPRSARVKVLAG